MRKGSLELDETVALIILVAAILIFLTWWTINTVSLRNAQEVEACRLSVLSYAKSWMDPADVPGVSDPHLFDIDCKRRVVTFTKKNIELNGKRMKFYDPEKKKTAKSYSKLTPAVLNHVAASEMATCWHEFLEGKSYFTNAIDLDNDDTACYVCGELRFSSDVEFDSTEQVEFFSYLASAKSEPYPQIRELTYFEFLYLDPHLCDHSGDSKLPGTADGVNWGDGIEWYDPDATETCEEQFLNKVLIGGKISEYGLQFNPLLIVIPYLAFFPEYDQYDPPMRELKLDANQSYYIVFFQLGEDEDTNDREQPEGTTYAPLILPSSKFTTKTCEKFIG